MQNDSFSPLTKMQPILGLGIRIRSPGTQWNYMAWFLYIHIFFLGKDFQLLSDFQMGLWLSPKINNFCSKEGWGFGKSKESLLHNLVSLHSS